MCMLSQHFAGVKQILGIHLLLKHLKKGTLMLPFNFLFDFFAVEEQLPKEKDAIEFVLMTRRGNKQQVIMIHHSRQFLRIYTCM